MSVVDVQAGAVTQRVQVGDEPEGVTVSPDGKVVYVTCEDDHTVVAIDTTSFAVLGRDHGRPAAAIDCGHAGRRHAVRHRRELGVDLGRERGAPHARRHDPPAQGRRRPDAAAADGRGAVARRARCCSSRTAGPGSSSVIDVAHAQLVRTLNDVGQRPWGIGINADGTKLFTANGPAGDVSIVDVATGAVERRISLGGSPWGIAVAAAP